MNRFAPRFFRRACEGLPPAFGYLFLATIVNRVGSFVVPFLALYLTEARALSAGDAGVVIALYGAGAIFCQPIGGMLADRLGRPRAIFTGLFIAAIATAHLGFARSLPHVAVAAFFVGLSEGLARPATNAAVTDLVAPEHRARAFGYMYWAANLGFAVASVVAGVLAHARFEVLFVADAATTLVVAGWVLARVPDTRGPTVRRALAFAPFLDRRFAALFGVTVLAAFVFTQFQTTMPLDIRAHGIGTATYGALAGLNGLLIVVLQPFAVRIGEGFRPTSALALGALLAGLGFAVLGFVETPIGYAFGITVLTLGEIAMAGSGPAVVADIAPAHARGTYQGAFGMAYSAAACLAPLIGTRALARLGSATFWVAMGVTSAVAAALYLVIGKRAAAADVSLTEDAASA